MAARRQGEVRAVADCFRKGLHASGRPHCYARGGNGALRFLGLRSSGPIAVSASVISRFDLRFGGSSC